MNQRKGKGGLGRGLGSLIPQSVPAGKGGVVGRTHHDELTETQAKRAAAQEATRRIAQRVDHSPLAGQPAGRATGAAANPGANPASKNKTVDASRAVPEGGNKPRLSSSAADIIIGGGQAPGNPEQEAAAQRAADFGATYQEIPIGAIGPNPKQPRHSFDEDALAELIHSIKEFGLMQPVVVRHSPDQPGTYELVMGERRWRAASKAGLKHIPAIVRETDDGDLLRDALLENIHRVQLNPLEEAMAYQQLLEEFGVTQSQLAERIGRSRPLITNMIRLLQLPVPVQRKVAAGVLSAGHARALLGLQAGAQAQEELASRVVAEGLSVRATEEAVTLLNRGDGPEPKKPRTKAPTPEFFSHAADRLADGLDTRVTVSVGKRKGRIVVEFGDKDDFERIVGLLGG